MPQMTLEQRKARRAARKAAQIAARDARRAAKGLAPIGPRVKLSKAEREARRLARRAQRQGRAGSAISPAQIAGTRRVSSENFAELRPLWSQRVATNMISWKEWRGMDIAANEDGTIDGIIPNVPEITGKITAFVKSLPGRAMQYITPAGDVVTAPPPPAMSAGGSNALPMLVAAGVLAFLLFGMKK